MTNISVSFEGRISVPKDVLINILGGESVLLNLNTERYFGLDEVGTHMWQALTTSASIEAAYHTLLAEYDVEPDQLRQDMADLIEKLVEQGLLNTEL